MRGRQPQSPWVAFTLPVGIYYVFYLVLMISAASSQNDNIAFFNSSTNSSVTLLHSSLNFSNNGFQRAFSFKTCSNGQLLYQRGRSGDYFSVHVINGTLDIRWKSGAHIENLFTTGNNFDNNEWYYFDLHTYLGETELRMEKGNSLVDRTFICNATYRSSLRTINLIGNTGLVIGKDFTGCILQGPGVAFKDNSDVRAVNVLWSRDTCPLNSMQCTTDENTQKFCYNYPCERGTCIDGTDTFICQCPHLYNGTRCENDLSVYGCAVSPCLHGGTCQSVDSVPTNTKPYRCNCIPGYTGVNCEKNIDECGPKPCKNGGHCIDGVNFYTCNCTDTGYNGTTCEENINECVSTPDICGAGTCFDRPGSFSCECPSGYDGHQCANNINECQPQPCQNGGSCQDLINTYKCHCVQGFSGSNCQTNIDDCTNVQCPGNNSQCVDSINSYSCECKPGFTGSPGSCTDIDECSANPCLYGATCQNLENRYECKCVDGYQGTNCENNINDCSPMPCKFSSSCEDGVNDYTCHCLPGYTDKNCSTNIDECITNNQPCKNGATCKDEVNGYKCECSAGWKGSTCEQDIDECEPAPCENGGTCHNFKNYYNCTCAAGFSGFNCSENINECDPNPCQNGGTCHDRINGYECTCTSEYMGKNCSQDYNACSFGPCKNNGSCSSTPKSTLYNCSCLEGFTDVNCSTNIDDCQSSPCTPPLVCFDRINAYECKCPIGYKGVNCTEEINECDPSPCKNGGTCTDLIGSYNCSCPQIFLNLTKYGNGQKLEFVAGFEGVNCERDINECGYVPSICLNNGTCVNTRGDYKCQCGEISSGVYTTGNNCELSTSYCESADEVKLNPPACHNGGTCHPGSESYTCSCAPGYTGRRCMTEIDECESMPCQYGGTCHDRVNGYNCSCIPGITGDNCEVDIDECQSNPCLHEGVCIDHINGYECNCTDTGFNGTNCELNIDDCASNPCQNEAKCNDLIKDYNCSCYEGYSGKNCEHDIDECASSPCQYNGTCLERSKQATFDKIPTLGNFSYSTAAGYVCQCINGITGVNCEINIDDCVNHTCQFGSTCQDQIAYYTCKCAAGYKGDRCQTEINECLEYQPCQHQSKCIDRIADYDCQCLDTENSQGQLFAGKNCSVELTACRNVGSGDRCQNGATCIPFLVTEKPEVQNFKCKCAPGFTSSKCEVPTTVNFNGETSSIQRTLSQINSNKISFRFRTTLADVILMTWQGSFWSTTMFTHIELHGGKLHMGYIAGQDMTLTYAIVPYAINDGNWQSVILHQDHQHKMLNLSLDTPQCSENTTECTKVVHYLPDASNNPHKSIVFGHTKSAVRTGKTLSKLVFKGCMQDITVNSKVILDKNTNITLPIDIGKGCPRTEQCLSDTCSGHGDCTDLWDDFECQCQRRYLGRKCDEEYIPVTFAKDNTDISWVSFNISQQQKDILSREINLSLFIRTREKNGLITFLGNDNTSYVTLELFNGYLASRLMLCQSQEFLLANRTLVDDGKQHFVGVHFGGGKFQLIWEGNAVKSKNIQQNIACPFDAEHLYFGGKIPDSLRSFRVKRNTNSVINADPIPALSSQPTYKGTIQDAELNNNKLVFYNSTTDVPSNYTVHSQTGIQSGEVTSDICQHEAPCTNNGTCSNVFFNDFSCKCPRGFRGKNCSEVDFCDEDSCPSTATCQSLHNGFECVSTVTFDGDKTHGEYIHNFRSSRQIRDISVELRTLVRNGLILYVKNGPYFLKIRVRGSKIQVICRLGNEAPEILEVDYKVNDREFHTVTVTENSSNMTVNIYGQQRNVTEDFVLKSKLKTISQLILEGKESNRTVILGYDRMSGEKLYYKGCLRVVRIGGVLLPFYSKNRFTNYTTSSDFEYFEAKTFVAEGYGCTKGEGCKSENQCKHSSKCVPDYYGYTCQCHPGYDGFWCENNKDDCGPSSCDNNGQCVDEVQNYTCQCPRGYSGNRCQISQNSCSPNPCQNSAPCVDEGGQFSCNCSSSFIGNTCDTAVTTPSCSSQPCKNGATCQNQTGQQPAFSCSCPSQYTGVLCDVPKDFCSDLPCLNGATCVNDFLGNTYNCTCVDGFEGKNCSIDIDECKSNPCLNSGQCIDQVNDYICNCTAGWRGSTCNQDVDECDFQPCQRGTCDNTDGSYRCDCTGTGYQGDKDCATDYNECTESPCANGATCQNTDGNYQCNCTEGYKEKNCTVIDCSQVNCTIGTCMPKPPLNNQWMCQCPTYYHGTYCEIPGPCSSSPCHLVNTASDCIELANLTDYTCICKSGWEGKNCSTDINECATSKPCIAQNTNNCTNLDGDYRCHCLPGFEDKNCSTNINECQSNPCVNGVCTDEINGYTCNCSEGYTNVSNCMEDINECAEGSDPCQNGAQCANSVGSYSCECVPGYVGKHCSIKDPDYKKITQDEDIWIIVGPVVAVVLLILIIGVIVFLMLARSKRATRGTYNPSRQEVIGSRVELGSVMKPPPEERLI